MEDWQKHIKHPHADYQGKAWCGASIMAWEWAFESTDHALLTVEQGQRLQPCPACVDHVQAILAQAEGQGEGA